MALSKLFLNAGEALRPVLVKVLPMKLLSKLKAGIINNATEKLSADTIEKYAPGRYKEGANIIGNIKGDNGLGQSARIMCSLLDENNEPHREAQEPMICMTAGLQHSFHMMLT